MTVEKFNACLDRISEDREAMAVLYSEYYDRVYATALYYMRNGDFAHDVASEVFMRLVQYRKTEQIRSPNAFLITVTKHCALNMLKNEWKYSPLEWGESASTQDINQDLYLKDIYSVLTEKEQQILVRHVFWGYKLNELAKQLGCSYPTIKRMYSRIKEKIKEYSLGISKGDKWDDSNKE